MRMPPARRFDPSPCDVFGGIAASLTNYPGWLRSLTSSLVRTACGGNVRAGVGQLSPCATDWGSSKSTSTHHTEPSRCRVAGMWESVMTRRMA